MLILYSTSDTVDDDFKNTLKTYNPGGLILMKENITTFDKTKKFVDDMQENSDIPMIISIDEEGGNVQVIRDNLMAGPIVYQRGVKSTDYQIGTQQVKEVVEDFNMPTDVIIIGPKNDMSYNCWDNSTFELDKYIQETWGKSAPPKIEDLSIPTELIAKLDISQRITYGSPTLRDGRLASFDNGNGIRHPQNVVPVAMHEMGALFTEYPYTYTVVKLREPICDLATL
jgi:hypothetical protein